jgi:hypothetical protein
MIPDLLARLATAIAVQDDPPISLAPCRQTVIAFESITGETMLRGRVIQALEAAIGPDWQQLVRQVA